MGARRHHISIGPAGGNGAIAAFLSDGMSDDGTRIFFDTRESLMASDTDTAFDMYVADVAGLSAAAGAPSPMRVSLVPAYSQCTAPNRTHGPPLASASCNPPVPSSSQLTLGSAGRERRPPNFVGFCPLYGAGRGPRAARTTPTWVTSSLYDVRCRPTGASCGSANAAGPADYTGQLQATVEVRITDRLNGPPGWRHGGGHGPGRLAVADSFPCAPTAATAIGSTCSLTTTVDAITPGLGAGGQAGDLGARPGAGERRRAGRRRATPPPNTLFATQGVFVP